MGDTKKPSLDKGLYIMTWQNPADDGNKHFELINGFGNLNWVVEGALKLRWVTETIAQNRILRIREQYSYFDGSTMSDGEHILTRTLDGKIIRTFPSRDKPLCPKCKVNVLVFNDICPKCASAELQGKINCCSKLCVAAKHEKCKGTGLLVLTGESCACDCHEEKEKDEDTFITEFMKWIE